MESNASPGGPHVRAQGTPAGATRNPPHPTPAPPVNFNGFRDAVQTVGSRAQGADTREAAKFLETVAGVRCPCGHLEQRHRKATGELSGEKWGKCRDCDCRGLVDFGDWDEDTDDV